MLLRITAFIAAAAAAGCAVLHVSNERVHGSADLPNSQVLWQLAQIAHGRRG